MALLSTDSIMENCCKLLWNFWYL